MFLNELLLGFRHKYQSGNHTFQHGNFEPHGALDNCLISCQTMAIGKLRNDLMINFTKLNNENMKLFRASIKPNLDVSDPFVPWDCSSKMISLSPLQC